MEQRYKDKDVPDFHKEEGEISTVGGSHQDILVGRQGHSTQSFNKASYSSDSKKTYILKLKSSEVAPKENNMKKLLTRQPRKKKLIEQSLSEELKFWSSASEESLLSDDSLHGMSKKRRKKTKKHYRSFGNPNLTLSTEYLRTPESGMIYNETYTSSDELCSECLWLVRTAKESKVSSSSEDLEWNQSGKNKLFKGKQGNSFTKPLDLKGYTEKDVLHLLNEVHLKLVECSIILTTYKLNNKVKKMVNDENLDKETPETLSDEKLLDDILDEEESKNGTSKLCLVLGKLVSKYLKVR